MKPHVLALSVLTLCLTACGSSFNGGDPVLVGSTAGGGTGAKAEFPTEPPLETDQAKLDAALHCTGFTHPDKPAVLLVHGTFTNGREQYEWSYIPLLDARGYDVCVVTYPDRGLGDQQISAEYVVNALRRMRAQSGRKVAMVGHSQGASMPRWALKWWPSARNAVDDFVLQAGPNHGTVIADPPALLSSLGLPLPPMAPGGPMPLPEAFRQFSPNSLFTQAVNRGDETPGDVDYTSLYGLTDELVQPAMPVPTAALEYGLSNPHVTNILLQDVCPQEIVDHVTIGTTDPLSFGLMLDAISHPGPADFQRAGGTALCTNVPIIADPALASAGAQALMTILQNDAANGLPDTHLSTAEPPLKPYAQ